MKKSLKTLLAVSALATCGALTSCAPKAQTFKFEAEQALLEDAEDQTANNIKVEASGEAASNGYSVGYFTTTGQKITWTVTSDFEAKDCELVLCLAPAAMTYKLEEGADPTDYSKYKMALADTDLSEQYKLTNNDKEISLGDTVVSPDNPYAEEGAWMPNFYQFKEYKFKVDLVKGENKIVFEKADGQNGVNVDYLSINAAANLKFTAVENELPTVEQAE